MVVGSKRLRGAVNNPHHLSYRHVTSWGSSTNLWQKHCIVKNSSPSYSSAVHVLLVYGWSLISSWSACRVDADSWECSSASCYLWCTNIRFLTGWATSAAAQTSGATGLRGDSSCYLEFVLVSGSRSSESLKSQQPLLSVHIISRLMSAFSNIPFQACFRPISEPISHVSSTTKISRQRRRRRMTFQI